MVRGRFNVSCRCRFGFIELVGWWWKNLFLRNCDQPHQITFHNESWQRLLFCSPCHNKLIIAPCTCYNFWSVPEHISHNRGIERLVIFANRNSPCWPWKVVLWSRWQCFYPATVAVPHWIGGNRLLNINSKWNWGSSGAGYFPGCTRVSFHGCLTGTLHVPVELPPGGMSWNMMPSIYLDWTELGQVVPYLPVWWESEWSPILAFAYPPSKTRLVWLPLIWDLQPSWTTAQYLFFWVGDGLLSAK